MIRGDEANARGVNFICMYVVQFAALHVKMKPRLLKREGSPRRAPLKSSRELDAFDVPFHSLAISTLQTL